MAIDDQTRKLLEIFLSYDRKRHKALAKSGFLLAHYTTAETAMKILRNRCLWLRNSAVMNDFSEVEYGRAVTKPVLDGGLGLRFKNLLNGLHEGLGDRVLECHANHHLHARETVYMASLSEHDPRDMFGRLSMWRAYGGPVAGVALLFHGWAADLEIEPSLAIGVSPVLYGTQQKFEIEFLEMLGHVEGNADFLKSLPASWIEAAAVQMLQLATLSIKHPGFEEELEWRIIHRPHEWSSAAVMPFTMALGGLPQTIYQMPFHNPEGHPLHNIPQLDLNDILACVMMGPCAYPETVFRALVDEMIASGIKDAHNRIVVSNIPLRQQW